MRWRRIQRRWKRVCLCKGPDLEFRTTNKYRYWLTGYAIFGNMKLNEFRAKKQLYHFLYDYMKKQQFILKTTHYYEMVTKILTKFKNLQQRVSERYEIVHKGYTEEKQRVLMKMAKSKNKKLRDQISKITKFQEVNVLRRYMRYI